MWVILNLGAQHLYIARRGRYIHRRRKRGGEGATRPPNFTHCLHNELYCSIVDRIACSSRKSHFCCLKKCRPPQVRTSSYAYDIILCQLFSRHFIFTLPAQGRIQGGGRSQDPPPPPPPPHTHTHTAQLYKGIVNLFGFLLGLEDRDA